MPPTVETEVVAAPRTTYRSSISFELAESRLRSTIQREQSPLTGIGLSAPPVFPTQEAFAEYIGSRVGPHGFMHFAEFNHGNWLKAYYPDFSRVIGNDGKAKNVRTIRFILGNPLIAQTMLRHDLDAGLSVPVELLLSEEVNGNAKVVHFRPVGLIAGYEGAPEGLVKAAKALDEKVETLINWVLRDIETNESKGNL
jgi:uncharacterized protein (DUF302 family)